jgi:hypothetical protein
VQEVRADDAALDVAVVAAADAQQVLVGALVEDGFHLGVVQRGLQGQGAGLGLGGVVQVQGQAVAQGAQGSTSIQLARRSMTLLACT